MQVIAAPKHIEDITGIAAIKVTAKHLVACDAKLAPMFRCNQRAGDFLNIEAASTVPEGFMLLVKMIAGRAAAK